MSVETALSALVDLAEDAVVSTIDTVSITCPHCRGMTGIMRWTSGAQRGRQRICENQTCRWEGIRAIAG